MIVIFVIRKKKIEWKILIVEIKIIGGKHKGIKQQFCGLLGGKMTTASSLDYLEEQK